MGLLDAPVTPASLGVVPKWKANTAYTAGDKVISPLGEIVSAVASFTSGATYSAANWSGLTAARIPSLQGSAAVRGMAYPTTTISPAPTFTAATTNTLPTLKSPYWTGFRNFGAPFFDNGLGQPSAYLRGPVRTDGTTPVWDGNGGIDFDFDGQAFEFRVAANASSCFRIWVDEVPHALLPQNTLAAVGGLSSGTNYWFKVDFGSARYRRIRLELQSPTLPMIFSGIRHAAIDSVLPPSRPSPRVMWITDSYGAGIAPAGQAPDRSATYPNIASKLLGFQDVWTYLTVPSTGLKQANAATPTIGNFRSRFANDVIPYKPDVIILQMSINDENNWPTWQGLVGPELTTCIDTLQTALPNMKMIVISPMFAQTPKAAYLTLRDEGKAACLAKGVPFIDTLDANAPLFTGTGYTGLTAGNGNADKYMSTDITHPNAAGYDVIARWLAGRIGPLLGQSN